jgi:RNA-directed DNA polymerase
MAGTPSPRAVSTKLQRIAKLASEVPAPLTALAHHIDIEWLQEAHRRTRKDGAPGVDGQTAQQYEQELSANLQSLLNRFKAGTYHAPPVSRVHIPKGDGSKTRPIGIPTFEDKVLQRAVAMVLEAIYEQHFMDCSYGFRPGRSAHDALEALWTKVMKMKGGWVLEIDIESFFDTLDHGHLRSLLDQRVRDGVMRRAIDKWLKAGVVERGEIRESEAGTPQGGVISPLLANIYLHDVLDRWFTLEVKSRLRGEAHLIRYADDAVLLFEVEEDARRVLDVLPKRFAKFGLKLHPTKTRLVRFRRPNYSPNVPRPPRGTKPSTFDFLGFTHYWGPGRSVGWLVKQKTASRRFDRALRRVSEWCRRHRHLTIAEQHKNLVWKLRGHYNYFGVRANGIALSRFWNEVKRVWRKWLNRRSRRSMPWPRFSRLLERYPLPWPTLPHGAHASAAKP